MILDESGSIGSAGATQDVRNAFKAFTDAIKNTSSAMAVAEFSKVARLPAIGAFSPGDYITVTDATQADLDAYIDSDYNPAGNTNWEDGLRMGIPNHAPRNNFQVPHLTVFITDGDPTQIIRGDRVTEDEYRNKVPLADNETTSAQNNVGADHAVANANNLKAQGSHILAIAVGSGLSSNAALNRLIKVSGPDVYDGTGDFDIATDDVYREPAFSKLQDALREAAFQLCAPSVTVQKLLDLTPDPGTSDDAVPGASWAIEGTVGAPGAGGYDWVLPAAESPATGPQSTSTDGTGFATFQWVPDEAGSSRFTATETIQSGFTNDPSATECSFRTPDTPTQPLPLDSVGNGTFSAEVPFESIVTCKFLNLAFPAPAIAIKKSTDGLDADTAPGPGIPVGQQVDWTYVVTNAGNTTLNNVVVTDAEFSPAAGAGPTVSCPKTTLAVGESMTCTATGLSGTTAAGAGFTGQYENLATVTAVDSYGAAVDDNDPSHYFAAAPGITIEKATNGDDADRPPGPLVAPGSEVNWSYVVTNTGNAPIDNIVVTDDREGSVTCPQTTLQVGGSMTCTEIAGTAGAGPYANRATVTGTAGTVTVNDEDPSHYFGVVLGLAVEKDTNGVDADVPPGPAITPGEEVFWTYVVTNTGNYPLTSWTVTDDQGVLVACPRVVLAPSASATCVARGNAIAGQYANIATASTPDPLGGPAITATDPSHYFGAQPALTVQKTTNGEDADDATGPFVPVGAPVNWSYAVTNTGNTLLTDLVVIDSQLGNVTANCIDTSLPVGASTVCSASANATAGQYRNLVLALAFGPDNRLVGALDPSHYFGADPGILLEKLTNGVDADAAPGPYIREGDPVEWSYQVTNTGNDPLTGITLTDDQLGPISCPLAALGPLETMTCTASGTATRGQYANVATVEARDPVGTLVSDADPSHYLGYITAIDVEKATNGEDADTPSGPILAVGSTVTWTYEVTNPGDIAHLTVALDDDQGVVPLFQAGDANGDGVLDPGETWLYEAQGVVAAGQYANTATVSAVDILENLVEEDTDPSHYFGAVLVPGIDIEKATNGEDADTAPGPQLQVGDAAYFTYVVTNTDTAPLTNVAVTDSDGVTISCPSGNPIPRLAPGTREVCTASRVATGGQYANVATATGRAPDGRSPSDSDPSHHFGLLAFPIGFGIDIEKATNGEDADDPTGPVLPAGSPVDFTYVVTNTGTEDLTNVAVTDDRGVPVTCPSGNPIPTLAAGASETCTANGTVAFGQYRNNGSATATGPDGGRYSVSDPSHHLGTRGPAVGVPMLSPPVLALLALLLGAMGAMAGFGRRSRL